MVLISQLMRQQARLVEFQPCVPGLVLVPEPEPEPESESDPEPVKEPVYEKVVDKCIYILIRILIRSFLAFSSYRLP